MPNGDDGGGDDGSESLERPAALLGEGPDRTLLERAAAGEQLGTDDIYRLLRQIAELSAPQRQGLALQGLQEWTRRARGSPQALLQTLGPQIRQIREQLQQAFTGVSKRLGPAGGRQIERGESAALGTAGTALARLFAGTQQQSTAGLVRFLQNLRPALLTQLPSLTRTETPGNYAALGQALSSGAALAGELWPRTSTATANQPILLPWSGSSTTPAVVNPYAGEI